MSSVQVSFIEFSPVQIILPEIGFRFVWVYSSQLSSAQLKKIDWIHFFGEKLRTFMLSVVIWANTRCLLEAAGFGRLFPAVQPGWREAVYSSSMCWGWERWDRLVLWRIGPWDDTWCPRSPFLADMSYYFCLLHMGCFQPHFTMNHLHNFHTHSHTPLLYFYSN